MKYTETINTLRSSLNLDYELDKKILDILPKLIEARAKFYAQGGLTTKSDNAIMEDEIRKKTNWVKGDKGLFAGSVPTFGGKTTRITNDEYIRLCHQIATDFPLLPADGQIHFYENRNCIYQFTVLEFGAYSFSFKAPIEGNEEKIAMLRGNVNE